MTDKGEHLHLIREKLPDDKPGYHIIAVWCPCCGREVYIIHLDLPPENPKH